MLRLRMTETQHPPVLVVLLAAALLSFGVLRSASAVERYDRPSAGAILLRFGQRYTDVNTSQRHRHYGIDIAAPRGALVRAAADGTVVFAGHAPQGGCVTIKHDDGIKTSYLPLQPLLVANGERVSRGQPVGRTAPAGDASSPAAHLHLGARFAEEYIDPESLFSGEFKLDYTKLIRLGNLPPGSAATAQLSTGPVDVPFFFWNTAGRFVAGIFDWGRDAGHRLLNFGNASRQFVGRQAVRFYKGSSAHLAKTWPAFSSRVRFILNGNQTTGIIVFDPSGDASEPDSRLSVALPGGNPTLSVTVYDSAADRVRTLEGWNQAASGVSWSGDDDTGAIVAPGMYTVIARQLDGRTTVILTEVRWHLY